MDFQEKLRETAKKKSFETLFEEKPLMIFRLLIFITFLGLPHLNYANSPKDKVADKKAQPLEASKPAEAQKKIEQTQTIKDLTLNEVSSYAKSMDSTAAAMSINFQEELYRHARQVTLSKEGSAYFIKPDMFRWEVSPVKQDNKEIWIFNGKDLFQHSTKEKYATRYSSKLGKNKQLKELVDIITNFKALLSNYRFDGAKKEGELVHVRLTPKQTSEIVFLEITLQTRETEKKPTFMKELTLHFEGKNRTKFKFEPIKDEKIADKNKLILPKEIKITDALN